MASKGSVRPGSVIWILPEDPNTHEQLGEHPAIVLTPQVDIDAGLDLFVVVCTTSFCYPLESGWFDVPTDPGGGETTGLRQACVAKATWRQIVPQSDVIRVSGRAKASLVRQIQQWLRDKQRDLRGERGQPPESE